MLTSKQVRLEFYSGPKKFKKYHKIKYKTSSMCLSSRKSIYALTCNNRTTFTIKQVVSLLKLIKPEMKNVSRRCLLRTFTSLDTIITQKAKDIRMGRGKGAPAGKIHMHAGGDRLFELRKLTALQAKFIFNMCRPKIGVTSRFINSTQW